jgi:four helix bundle protein
LSRAADSVAATIVEGCGAATQREFARYLDIAIKSAAEVQYHLISARDRAVLPDSEWHTLSADVVHVRRMLYALRKKVLSDLS